MPNGREPMSRYAHAHWRNARAILRSLTIAVMMVRRSLRSPMKKQFIYIIIFLCISFLTSCAPIVHHADPFYDLNGSEYPRGHIPLINPVQATRDIHSSSWNLELLNSLHIDLPKSQEQEVRKVYIYSRITELDKFAVEDGVILAYSDHVNQQAEAYIQESFYHWFVLIPSEYITEGFHTEDEFTQYVETLGIQDPNWQTPDDAFDTFLKTGCLDWFPDCK